MDNFKNKSFQEQHNHLDINKWKPKKRTMLAMGNMN